jgi:regulator of cell morphogenesis and NO signaling
MHSISAGTPIGDIIAHDLRTAKVFNRYGLDFCCGGRATLAEACRVREIDPGRVLGDLRDIDGTAEPPLDVTTWPLEQIIERIVSHHHVYVRRRIPEIATYLERLTLTHGAERPELPRIATIFSGVATDLTRHMQKEELVLFPYIQALAVAERTHRPLPETPFGSVTVPIDAMRDEHADAAAELWLLRVLTNEYQPPQHACATWRVCYQALDEFERDLQQHVHLENNVLFPAALRIEKALG